MTVIMLGFGRQEAESLGRKDLAALGLAETEAAKG
jgi:hypothetical protein